MATKTLPPSHPHPLPARPGPSSSMKRAPPPTSTASYQTPAPHPLPAPPAKTSYAMKGQSPTVAEAERCPHVDHLLRGKLGLVDRLRDILRWGILQKSGRGSSSSSSSTMQPPACSACHKTLSRPFACLSCSFMGCFGKEAHMLGHLRATSHPFCADAMSGAVYCAHPSCGDVVYSPALDALIRSVRSDVEEELYGGPSRRKRARYEPWQATPSQTALLSAATPLTCRGLRGITNIGQTCFLAVIVQSFIHNPLLRSYFLGDRHNRHTCPRKSCMSCQLDLAFSEFYADGKRPFAPVTMLSTMWANSADLAGYAQQDAHEFFISTLSQIHNTCTSSTRLPSCPCPVHSIFYGLLQSNVQCGSCSHVTSAFDPILDISLDLRTHAISEGENSLAKCLRRYTSREANQQYSCSRCGVSAFTATKQLSLSKVPPVLCFQFKRFERLPNATSTKIDLPVRFPAKIDMSPYVSSPLSSSSASAMGDSMVWDLFAVVCHIGKIDTGHYTNFARVRDEWFHFDDEKVNRCSLGTVLDCKPYMLFYVKRHLEYEHKHA